MVHWLTLPLRLRRRGVLGMNARNAGPVLGHNPRALFPLVDDKLRFLELCGRIGVPTPAVFGPNCARHIILLDRTWLTTQTLPDPGGVQRSMSAALTSWIGGASIRLIDDDPARISVCPD